MERDHPIPEHNSPANAVPGVEDNLARLPLDGPPYSGSDHRAKTTELRSISCVMPAYNECESIRVAIGRVREALEQLTRRFEIIVINDGSTDGTGAILDDMADDRLRVVHFRHNLGYGTALRHGFELARHSLVFFTDSDDQFEPADLSGLLAHIADHDLVVGYRVGRCDGLARALLSKGYNAMMQWLLGIDVRDINCAFKLIRRPALSSLNLTSDSYLINAEILVRARQSGLRLREMPVRHRHRYGGRSKVGLGEIPRSLIRIVKLQNTLREACIRQVAADDAAAGPQRASNTHS